MDSISDSMDPSNFLESGLIIAFMYVMGQSLSNNNMACCYVVRSVNFLVVRHAVIDLCGTGTSTSVDTTSCTSFMGSVGAKTFSGVS
jgi:hypothetical protein